MKLTDILEWQKLNATHALGGSSNIGDTLNSFKANASFVWDHKATDLLKSEPAVARADYLVERDGFEPEISLAVLPNTQSELPFG